MKALKSRISNTKESVRLLHLMEESLSTKPNRNLPVKVEKVKQKVTPQIQMKTELLRLFPGNLKVQDPQSHNTILSDIDLNRFSNENEYRHDTILGMAMFVHHVHV
jgi:hypothetical protein